MSQNEKIDPISDEEEDFEMVSLDEGTPAACMACGGKLKTASLLICKECLGDECEQFLSLVEG